MPRHRREERATACRGHQLSRSQQLQLREPERQVFERLLELVSRAPLYLKPKQVSYYSLSHTFVTMQTMNPFSSILYDSTVFASWRILPDDHDPMGQRRGHLRSSEGRTRT